MKIKFRTTREKERDTDHELVFCYSDPSSSQNVLPYFIFLKFSHAGRLQIWRQVPIERKKFSISPSFALSRSLCTSPRRRNIFFFDLSDYENPLPHKRYPSISKPNDNKWKVWLQLRACTDADAFDDWFENFL